VDNRHRILTIACSGMGCDGTLGVKAIKEQLGMVMVQAPDSAKYDGMPRRAINTGLVDFVAPAEQPPVKLIQYVNHVPPPLEDREEPLEAEPSTALQKVFVLLRTQTGNDFSCYKKGTINRRIQRRMGVHQFDDLRRYARFLQENPQEVRLLHKEMLIGVTGFFRDAGLFDVLRVWNPGCSTGEETLCRFANRGAEIEAADLVKHIEKQVVPAWSRWFWRLVSPVFDNPFSVAATFATI
jgi:two-component system, chemotaxis family, CheB/CheR fusion protein